MPQKLYGSPLPEGCLLLLVIPFKFHLLSLLHSYERSDKLFGGGLQDVFTNSIFSGVLSTLNVHFLESTLNDYWNVHPTQKPDSSVKNVHQMPESILRILVADLLGFIKNLMQMHLNLSIIKIPEHNVNKKILHSKLKLSKHKKAYWHIDSLVWVPIMLAFPLNNIITAHNFWKLWYHLINKVSYIW